ncbi:MAG: methylated-DNA--[protein]-cysteine S-methyltransferase [Acidobacteriota bacterium]|nr:methylated-DNA--[protein]-cysteine S-methyltransferase [Acidobacteriota bacterium]
MTARLPTLRASLSERADRAGLLDIAYRTLETPIGSLLLAATGAGLLRVAFATEDHDRVLDQLARRVSPRLLTAPRRLDRAAREIDEYFAQRRRRFALRLDLQLAHGFRREVLDHLARVPYGATVSYGGLAAAAGSPRAVRAAGSACATNPLPIVVPCHRVLRSDGSLGRYGGGAHVKRALLLLEGAQAPTMG